jgi:hypothetical protein
MQTYWGLQTEGMTKTMTRENEKSAPKPRRRKQADRAMTEIHATRQANFKVLVDQAGMAVTMAVLLTGFRPISEKVARKIEEKLRLAPGWLDIKHVKGDE